MATRQSVVLFGDFSEERIPMEAIATEFGFAIHSVGRLADLHNIQKENKIAAVLVRLDSAASPWQDLLAQIRSILKGAAKIIACHRPELADFRQQMAAGGAFYTLLTPMAAAEVRQALGFVWAASRARVHEMPAKGTLRHVSRSAGVA